MHGTILKMFSLLQVCFNTNVFGYVKKKVIPVTVSISCNCMSKWSNRSCIMLEPAAVSP